MSEDRGPGSDSSREDDERHRSRKRESADQTREVAKPLTEEEREQLTDNARLSAVTIYAIIRREGEEELNRPAVSLWWSGVAAGVGISASLVAEAALRVHLGEGPGGKLITSLGYSVGFILVILSRLQLFTENTISVILPLLAERDGEHFRQTGRLWGIVLVANLVGTFFVAVITLYAGPLPPDVAESMVALSIEATEPRGMQALLFGVPAGFLIASLVWILPSSKGFELFSILLFTYVIVISGSTHVIVGSLEVFLVMLNGDITVLAGIVGFLLPVLAGNIIGGTGLFAMLAYGQVHEEM